MPTLDDLIARCEGIAAAARGLSEELRAYQRIQKQSGKVPELKQADGKLTEEGVRVLVAGLRAKKTASEIARSLGITVPAVLYRKRVLDQAAQHQRGRR